MLLKLAAEGCFSAIAASFNPSFERICAKSRAGLSIQTLEGIMSCEIANFIGAMTISIFVWIIAMLALRYESFKPDGSRKIEPPISSDNTATAKDLYEQCKYHGEGIYKDLDLFFKITLAIFGGIAYVALSGPTKTNLALIKTLIEWGLWLQLFTAVFTTTFVLAHKRSIILRWKKRFSWWYIFLWGETWGYIAGMAITFYAFFVVGPRLIAMIAPAQNGL